jgi:LacI family transcriptional regulator
MKQKPASMDLALAGRHGQKAPDPFETDLVSGDRAVDPAPAKEPGVRDVARAANVSVATVSLVINDNPRISRATQERVRQVMADMGYKPNRLAQNLASRDTRMLCVMLPSLGHAFADRYFGELMSGIFERARMLGYKVMLEQATPEFIETHQHLDLFQRRFVDGVLCLGNNDRHPFLNDFAAEGRCPAIVVNNYFPQWPDLDYVVCDYRGGAEQAMNYLFQLGHRRIGIISGSDRVQTARDVVETYRRKLTEAGIEPLATWLEDGLFTESGGADAAKRLMERHPDLTAILAGNDKMAVGALHYLDHAGRSVPGDVSLVGFDDMEHAAFVRPALSTVHLPLYETGVLACERLVQRIRGSTDPVRAVLPTHLVIRESCGLASGAHVTVG